VVAQGTRYRSTRLLAGLGPTLCAVLDVGTETTEDEVRTRLQSLVVTAAAALPNDLNLLVQAAFGITSSHPLLNQRMADVGRLLQRDLRTLRRRLAEADELLADRIVLRFAARQGLARPGFHWVSYHFDVDVSDDHPVFVSTRTLVSSLDQLTAISEIVSIPLVGDSDSLHVEGLVGCTYVGRDSLSDTSWRLWFSLPRPLALGETHDTVVRFTWPGRDWIQPVAAIVPMRPVERFGVRVSFGDPRSCSAAWVLNGTVPTGTADPSSGEPLTAETIEVPSMISSWATRTGSPGPDANRYATRWTSSRSCKHQPVPWHELRIWRPPRERPGTALTNRHEERLTRNLVKPRNSSRFSMWWEWFPTMDVTTTRPPTSSNQWMRYLRAPSIVRSLARGFIP